MSELNKKNFLQYKKSFLQSLNQMLNLKDNYRIKIMLEEMEALQTKYRADYYRFGEDFIDLYNRFISSKECVKLLLYRVKDLYCRIIKISNKKENNDI